MFVYILAVCIYYILGFFRVFYNFLGVFYFFLSICQLYKEAHSFGPLSLSPSKMQYEKRPLRRCAEIANDNFKVFFMKQEDKLPLNDFNEEDDFKDRKDSLYTEKSGLTSCSRYPCILPSTWKFENVESIKQQFSRHGRRCGCWSKRPTKVPSQIDNQSLGLLDLPFEVLKIILSFMECTDIYAMRLTCAAFFNSDELINSKPTLHNCQKWRLSPFERELCLQNPHKFIKTIKLLYDYSRKVYGCEICLKPKVSTIYWNFGIRCCLECFSSLTVNAHSLRTSSWFACDVFVGLKTCQIWKYDHCTKTHFKAAVYLIADVDDRIRQHYGLANEYSVANLPKLLYAIGIYPCVSKFLPSQLQNMPHFVWEKTALGQKRMIFRARRNMLKTPFKKPLRKISQFSKKKR